MNERELLADASHLDRSHALLFQKYLEGTLTEVELAKFEEMLKADKEHRTLLVSICIQRALTPRLLSQEDGATSGDADQLAVPIAPTPRSKSWSDRAYRRALRPAIAVATVATVLVVGWAAVTYVSEQVAGGGGKDAETRQPAAEFVAWYMGAHEVEWLDGTEPKKTRLKLGQKLAITKGMIKVQYVTGVNVVIEGPAEFWVGGTKAEGSKVQREDLANSGYLKLGKLVAHVHGKKADGFTIDTPTGRVEDHGTEFGVEVDDGGGSEFVVLSGEVDLIREQRDGGKRERVRLMKGQGAFVGGRGGTITRRANVDVRVVAAMRRRLDDLFAASGLADGDSEMIVNASFENPQVADAMHFDQIISDSWSGSGGGSITTSNIGFGGAGSRLIQGNQWTYFNAGGTRRQLIGPARLDANQTYTVSFVQYQQFNGDSFGEIRVEIWDGNPESGGTMLDSKTFGELAAGAGAGARRGAVLNTGLSATSGGDLWLGFSALPGSEGGISRVGLDAVRVVKASRPNTNQ
jgi:ferric-dicitrate binding protein FerR (iron transport regulator)